MGILSGVLNQVKEIKDEQNGTTTVDGKYIQISNPGDKYGLDELPVAGMNDVRNVQRPNTDPDDEKAGLGWLEADSYFVDNNSNGNLRSSRESNPLMNSFDVPAWGIKDYMNERAAFQKKLDSALDEPGWFYFKIFFKFDTSYGLLGGVLNNKGEFFQENTALKYLYQIRNRYWQEDINSRIKALIKFIKTLSFISCEAPWFFQSVAGTDEALKHDLSKAPEKKSLNIKFLQEAVDMRISQLFDMYRYAAYDFTHDKEILPENLRKFDMDIVLFQSPIKYLQTSMKDLLNNSVPYKNMNDTNMYNRMSFRIFTFQNCEIDLESLSTITPSDLKNERAFNIEPSLKINYEKCYVHTLNEWTQNLVGDSGFLWDGTDSPSSKAHKISEEPAKGGTEHDLRVNMLQNAYDNQHYYNKNSSVYQYLVEASEDVISNAMRIVSPKAALGNLYKETTFGDILEGAGDTIKDQFKSLGSNLNPFKGLF